jgi:hypothetical protein
MPRYYRLANPAVSSFSVDGVEHVVNGDGVLEVHEDTPNLAAELLLRGAVPALDEPGPAEQQAGADLRAAEDIERADLFDWLDKSYGRRIDRRRSTKQLRDMKLALMQKEQQRRDAAAAGQPVEEAPPVEEPPVDSGPGPAREA